MKHEANRIGTYSLRTALVAAAMIGVAAPALAALLPEHIVPDACRASALATPGSCTLCHIGELVINLTQYLIWGVALPATILFVAIGGLVLLASGASETRRTLGKKILLNTLIGAIIVLVAWLGVDTLIRILTGTNQLSQFGPWNEFKTENCSL